MFSLFFISRQFWPRTFFWHTWGPLFGQTFLNPGCACTLQVVRWECCWIDCTTLLLCCDVSSLQVSRFVCF